MRRVLRSTVGRRIQAAHPVLSVIIPVYNVEQYLPECLDSALCQSEQNLEVIAVDDGSTDSSLRILREYAAKDPRVSVYQQTNSGQGVARNLGVSKARGKFLTFLDSDDTVPPLAYGYMLGTLRKTGSDFCVGSARRFSNNRFSSTPWLRAVHQTDRFGVTIDEFPAAIQDIIACNRMFRTAFWVEKVGSFRGHIAYEDHVPMLTAYVRATKFDILSGITYNWRVREDKTSTGQQKHSLENLLDRIAVKEEANTMLLAEATKHVYDAWVARALEVDFPAFIVHGLAADEMYRNCLSAAYRTFFSRASEAALRDVRFYQKIRGWLIAESRWTDLERVGEYFRQVGQLPPTLVKDGRIIAATDSDSSFLTGVPPQICELSNHETSFDAAIERLRWIGETRLQVIGWTFVRSLDTSGAHPEIEVSLVDSQTGERHTLAVEPRFTPAPTLWAGHLNAAYDGAGFSVDIDVGALNQDAVRTPRLWTMHVTVSQQGILRAGTIHSWQKGLPPATLSPRLLAIGGGPGVVQPVFDKVQGFSLSMRPTAVVAEELAVRPGSRMLSGVLRVIDPERGELRALRATCPTPKLSATARLSARSDRTARFELELPTAPVAGSERTTTFWRLKASLKRGPSSEVGWPLSAPPQPPEAAAEIVWRNAGDGTVSMLADSRLLEVNRVEVTPTEMILDIGHDRFTAEELRTARLGTPNVEMPLVDCSTGDDSSASLRFDRRASILGGPKLPAPSGEYRLTFRDVHGNIVPGMTGPGIVDDLPFDANDATMNVRLWSTRAGEQRITISPPLRPDERGVTRQKAMQRRYLEFEPEPSQSVLFQCYRGEFATDSQRALDGGLSVARPDLQRFWGVKDLATEVPDGSTPLVIGSRGWYDALASSRYLCNNIDFDGFFRKRPHQRYLQTFHGYPFKSMGTSFWQGKGFGPDRIALEVARRNEEWDSILVPSEMCADFYRAEYAYQGDILVTGYPRSDFPVNADRNQVRRDLLGRLGLPEGKTVLLYAPTYRDNLTTRTYAAKRFDELDLVQLTSALGEDYIVLLRGHNNNQRELDRVLHLANVVDVTDFPEINELTVAADVAILDYSSLRFDWALTGKPMLFFVPDVDSYFASRPPLFDFRSSAPGPLLSTTSDVIASLRHLDEVAARFSEDIISFNERFNRLHDGKATQRVIDAFFT